MKSFLKSSLTSLLLLAFANVCFAECNCKKTLNSQNTSVPEQEVVEEAADDSLENIEALA